MESRRVKLELNFTGNGLFLNAWDSENGNDICARCYGSDMFDIDGVQCNFNELVNMIATRENIDEYK